MALEKREICHFMQGGECKALKDWWCIGCKFHKTHDEYKHGLEHAAEILDAKGLDVRIIGNVVTTVRKER